MGYSLRPPELLFRKIEDEEVVTQIEKLKSGLVKPNAGSQLPVISKEPEAAPSAKLATGNLKPEIQFGDFSKLDLRIGTIVAAEKVEKADKLLKLQVDLGFEKRTIVSGIALHFNPGELLGRQVVVVANLAPRKLRGIESNGMILSAEDEKGKLHLIKPEEIINPGAGVS